MCAIDKSPQNDPALKLSKFNVKFVTKIPRGLPHWEGGGANIFTNTFVCYYSDCAKVLVEIFTPLGMVAYEEFSWWLRVTFKLFRSSNLCKRSFTLKFDRSLHNYLQNTDRIGFCNLNAHEDKKRHLSGTKAARVGEIQCLIFQQNNVMPFEIYSNCIQFNIVFHTIIIFLGNIKKI